MIESGSHVSGISAEDFGLPPFSAMRMELPAEAVRRYFPAYFVLDSSYAVGRFGMEWLLPTWGQIWVVMAQGPITVQLGNRVYDRLASAVLYGVTSRAMRVQAQGGVTIGLEVSPLGWARLLRVSAESLRDQVTPLEKILPPDMVHELTRALAQSDQALEVKSILDVLLERYLGAPHRDEPQIATIMQLIDDESLADLTAAASAHGIDAVTVRRLSKRYFGFPPKILMMRRRFLRALLPLLEQGAAADHAAVPRGYHDRSHFLRDAQRFLGVTPRQMLKDKSPYAAAARRARSLVIGAPFA